MSSASAQFMRGFFKVKTGPATSISEVHSAKDPSMMEEVSDEGLSTSNFGVTVSLGYESDLADDKPIDINDMLSEDGGGDSDAEEEMNEPHRKRRRTLEIPARDQRDTNWIPYKLRHQTEKKKGKWYFFNPI
jgi:hypothetical protein